MLANELRPQTFAEVKGQDHIVTTLLNSVERDHVFQTLLLAGPSGTGKTTVARLTAQLYGVDLTLDYYEEDAASQARIDNIRQLIDYAQTLPISPRSTYKAICLDEAHGIMKSKPAADALLKLLEEPPAHVLIILCTTNPRKLSETIISRCTWFPFRSLAPHHTLAILDRAVTAYGLDPEPGTLETIVTQAKGNARQALSTLENFTVGIPFTHESLRMFSGGALPQDIEILAGNILTGQTGIALDQLNYIRESGATPETVTEQLITCVRDAWADGYGLGDTSGIYQLAVDQPPADLAPVIQILAGLNGSGYDWIPLEMTISELGAQFSTPEQEHTF